jgi:hypothetical protein
VGGGDTGVSVTYPVTDFDQGSGGIDENDPRLPWHGWGCLRHVFLACYLNLRRDRKVSKTPESESLPETEASPNPIKLLNNEESV